MFLPEFITDTSFLLQIVEGSLLDTAQGLNIKELINRLIAYALIIAGLLSVVFMFMGGFLFIVSGGQEEKKKQALDTIRYSIFGLIITLLAVIIVNTVGQIIGLNTIKYIQFDEIVQTITNISEDLSSSGSSSSRSLD